MAKCGMIQARLIIPIRHAISMRSLICAFLALVLLSSIASAVSIVPIPITLNVTNMINASSLNQTNQAGSDTTVIGKPGLIAMPLVNQTQSANQTNRTIATISPTRVISISGGKTAIALNISKLGLSTIIAPSADRIVKGPIDTSGLDDGDNDGVINLMDQCPNTPNDSLVYDNGCRCQDSEAGWDKYYKGTIEFREKVPSLNLNPGSGDKNKTGIGYSITNYFADDSCTSIGSTSYVVEKYCNPNYETGASDEPIASISFPCGFGCSGGTCKRMYACASSSGGTCSDGIQNQDETGVDCGGKCAPCSTTCTTGAKYAPSDTPCTSYYPTDMHRINLTWTDGELEYPCRWYEICHPDLDFVIQEAQECCSVISEEELSSMPDRNLCKEALDLGGGNCRKCTGMYIIKGMGTYARWMKGYQELDTLYTNPIPSAEHLINDYKIGVCRDYSLATATLLRKAGYSQDDIGNTCDGAHCYNVVRFPGDAKWTVVDTTGNSFDVNPGGLPQSGYEYCKNLNESRWCFWVNNTSPGYHTNTIPDVDGYWSIVDSGGTYDYPHATICYPQTRTFAPMCGPGVACGKDSWRIPDFAPSINDIVGCS